MPFIEISGLHAGYGSVEIVRDLGLRLEKGQSACLVGPNGSGKSTVLNAFFGLARVFKGSIKVDGREVVHHSPRERLLKAKMAYVLQDSSVFPDMSVEENLWMGGFYKKNLQLEKIFDDYPVLAQRRRQKARVLSGGERRMLEIARALVMEPDVLLIDEPSIGLAPKVVRQVFELLEDLKNRGKTILLVEQNVKSGLQFADTGYFMRSGKLILSAPGKDLLADPSIGKMFLLN